MKIVSSSASKFLHDEIVFSIFLPDFLAFTDYWGDLQFLQIAIVHFTQ